MWFSPETSELKYKTSTYICLGMLSTKTHSKLETGKRIWHKKKNNEKYGYAKPGTIALKNYLFSF